ncbi:phospholipase YtpA [Rubritalea halochordaticola]|uniref:Phospholipase YtpA n=1 Tax=Rubritalea halochordaticola TaxID=714537 RepID=A0ABP9UW72_9BACT
MNPEYLYTEIDGHLMHRIIMHPNPGTPLRAACIFNHGQGDYGERYLDVLHPFTERGIRCIVTDLLGHGRSPGKRGHTGSIPHMDAVIRSNIEATDSLPYGIAGHSMGGLLTLRHLTLALQDKLQRPEFCWVNAPLLRPGNKHSDTFISFVGKLSQMIPRFTIHTGVTPDMCRHGEDPKGKMPKDPAQLGHQRVSLGWGIDLLKMEEHVHNYLPNFTDALPFLFTQGGSDEVCPAAFARKFFDQLKLSNRHYHEFADMRHETFAEPNRDRLFQTLAKWIDAIALPELHSIA